MRETETQLHLVSAGLAAAEQRAKEMKSAGDVKGFLEAKTKSDRLLKERTTLDVRLANLKKQDSSLETAKQLLAESKASEVATRLARRDGITSTTVEHAAAAITRAQDAAHDVSVVVAEHEREALDRLAAAADEMDSVMTDGADAEPGAVRYPLMSPAKREAWLAEYQSEREQAFADQFDGLLVPATHVGEANREHRSHGGAPIPLVQRDRPHVAGTNDAIARTFAMQMATNARGFSGRGKPAVTLAR